MSNATYPSDMYVVELSGQDRYDYLSNISDTYNDLKSKGYAVPSATVKGEGDTTYIEFELIYGDNIDNLVEEGVITRDEAKNIRRRALDISDKIRREQDITIFNVHGGNIFYNPKTDSVYLYDVIQNNKNMLASKVTRYSQAYLDSINSTSDSNL